MSHTSNCNNHNDCGIISVEMKHNNLIWEQHSNKTSSAEMKHKNLISEQHSISWKNWEVPQVHHECVSAAKSWITVFLLQGGYFALTDPGLLMSYFMFLFLATLLQCCHNNNVHSSTLHGDQVTRSVKIVYNFRAPSPWTKVLSEDHASCLRKKEINLH